MDVIRPPAGPSSPVPSGLRLQLLRIPVLVSLGVFAMSAPALAQEDAASTGQPAPSETKRPAELLDGKVTDQAAMTLFLDRLMLAESGGRDEARNPRSTAVGPFQFIESTFLEVARRHFPSETDKLTPAQVLQLRTNRQFARRAAEAFTRDNAAHLAVAGLDPSFANLRLAFLVGPGGAIKVLKADPQTPAVTILGTPVVQANPFMIGMTTADLARWSSRNLSAAALGSTRLSADPSRVAGSSRAASRLAIPVRCNRALVSCRRWIALATRRVTRHAAGEGGRRRSR